MTRLLALLFAALATAAPAQDAAARLEAAEAALQAARSSLGDRRALSQAIRAYEVIGAELGGDLATVAAERRAAQRALEAQSADLQRLLAALTRLGLAARPTMLTDPATIEAARAVLIAERLSARAGAAAADLEAARAHLVDLEARHAAVLDQLRRRRARLSAIRDELIAGAAARRRRDGPLPDIGADAAALAALARLATQAAPVSAPPPPDLALPLPSPVQGRLIRRAGAPDPAGQTRPGIAIAAPAGALVTSPADATVRFAGRIDGYGLVVMLEPASEVLLILGGVADPLVTPGRGVAEGDPVAFLPGFTDHELFSDSVPDGSGQLAAKTLYIEVRQGRQPVDPLTWFDF